MPIGLRYRRNEIDRKMEDEENQMGENNPKTKYQILPSAVITANKCLPKMASLKQQRAKGE